MTHRHAFRRGVAARPSDKDFRIWRRLAKRAEQAGRDPEGRALPFVLAAEKANKALVPIGWRTPEQCFFRTVRIGLGFLKLDPAQKAAKAATLLELAAEIDAAVDQAEAAAGGGRERRDVDG